MSIPAGSMSPEIGRNLLPVQGHEEKKIWHKGHLQNNPGNWRRPGVGSSLALGGGWRTFGK